MAESISDMASNQSGERRVVSQLMEGLKPCPCAIRFTTGRSGIEKTIEIYPASRSDFVCARSSSLPHSPFGDKAQRACRLERLHFH